MSEYAAILSEVAGKPVVYVDIPLPALKEAMLGAGLPEFFSDVLVDSEACAAKGALFNDSKTLSKLIGRPTCPIRETLKMALVS